MRGRKPKPTARKKLHGNPGKRKLPKHEPRPQPLSDAAPPAHLSADAQLEWRRMLGELRALGMVSALDLGLLAAWCTAWGDYVEAERQIRATSAVIKDRDKRLRRNPWSFIKNKAIEQMARLAGEFGLSPASRPRLGRPAAAASAPEAQPSHVGNPAPQSLDSFLDSHPGGKAVH